MKKIKGGESTIRDGVVGGGRRKKIKFCARYVGAHYYLVLGGRRCRCSRSGCRCRCRGCGDIIFGLLFHYLGSILAIGLHFVLSFRSCGLLNLCFHVWLWLWLLWLLWLLRLMY